jgi:hypothetical protein
VPQVWLFIVMCVAGGLGALAGSVIGHAVGPHGLLTGALLGGLAAVALGARLAVWRGWIVQTQWRATALGGELGFVLAALIATRTLKSPLGPILSTLLIGGGAVLGANLATRLARDRVV